VDRIDSAGRSRPGVPILDRLPESRGSRSRLASPREASMLLRWFHAIMPKEERFFDLFSRHSEVVLDGAKALRAMLEGGDSVPKHSREVMDFESRADEVTREVLITVRRSFITPFDRGAIKDLITAMDNTIDQMQKTAKGIILFDVRSFSPEMQQMGDAIVEAATLVREAIPLLQSINNEAGRISSLTQKVSEIEGQADDLHDIGLKKLYEAQGKSNAMAFIVGNEVYDHLEKVVDRFDDVANEIHGIVLEHV
jgi:predicted phosphate transport protein (TIGR00153 family)